MLCLCRKCGPTFQPARSQAAVLLTRLSTRMSGVFLASRQVSFETSQHLFEPDEAAPRTVRSRLGIPCPYARRIPSFSAPSRVVQLSALSQAANAPWDKAHLPSTSFSLTASKMDS